MRLLLLAALLLALLAHSATALPALRRGKAGGRVLRASTAAAARPQAPAAQEHQPAPSSRFTVLAELSDGPTEFEAKQRAGSDAAASSKPIPFESLASLGGRGPPVQPAFSPAERRMHAEAAAAARRYAMQYVSRLGVHTAGVEVEQPHAAHGSSALERLAAEKGRAQAKANQKQKKQKKQKKEKEQGAFRFAEAGVFLEHGVKVDSFPKQEWTYSDSSSPPGWAALDPAAAQGCPTTKPPPVPRMPAPPPPQPTPTWMSPWDEHLEPSFPHSDTPAPTYGMGPVPPSPPENYLPLDAFIAPGPT